MKNSKAHNRLHMFGMSHFFGLWGIAIAQPLFSVLGQSPEFFVAHNFGSLQLVLFAALLAISVPLYLACGVGLIAAVFPKLRLRLQGCIVGGLLLVGVSAFLNLASDLKAFLVIPFSTSVAILGAYFYWKSAEFRRFFSFLALLALLFPIHFLFFGPILAVVSVDPESASPVSQVDSRTPVVLVVLDEFSASSLTSKSNEIDAIRFPNLASVAEQAHWFPNAITPHPETMRAMPGILTGVFTSKFKSANPSYAGYPDNLFNWLGPSYQMNVLETVTSICPPEYCKSAKTVDVQLLVQDLFVVFAYLVMPSPYSDKLPRLDQNWKGFARPEPEDFGKVFLDKFLKAQKSGRIRSFENFIAAVEPGTSTLDFVHVLLPHSPYKYGADFYHQGEISRELRSGETYFDDEYTVRYSQLLYLHQVSAVDALVGKLVAHLKTLGKYEDALLIITADHGVAFKPGVSRRAFYVGNAPELLNVPLLVKLPRQVSSVVSEQFVSNLDIVATIADVLGTKVPWENQGQSIFSDDYSNMNIRFDYKEWDPKIDVSALSQKIYDGFPLRDPASDSELGASTVTTKYDRLLGASVADLHSVSSGVEMKSEDLALLDSVNRESGLLPILVRGYLLRFPVESNAQWIAIGLNGKIEAISPLYDGSDDFTKRFRAVLPPKQIKEVKNVLDFFLIEDSSTGEIFTRVNLNAD